MGGCKVGPVGQGLCLAGHPLGPPLHMASLCQVYSWGDTYFGRIPNFLVIP
jgi:hypothetical protein